MSAFETCQNIDIAWCPGCGNFSIREVLIETLQELNLDPAQVVISSGIGQAAKMPQYIEANYFNGLHGRALPAAVGIKSANPKLTVLAEGGDGDMYGEGGNHFIHNIRRNPDITHIVHNNMVYGLTKGQASPTTQKGFKNNLQVGGVVNESLNPLFLALSLGARFVARTFSNDKELTKKLLKAAIEYKGYALVDILQPCPSFNKINTHGWYQENTYKLDDKYDASSLSNAIEKAMETERMPLGILYKGEEKPTLEEQFLPYIEDDTPIIKRSRDIAMVNKLMMP